VERIIFVIILVIFLAGCSASENTTTNEDSYLLRELKASEWESSSCEDHLGHPYTTHTFTVSDSELIFKYLDYGPECIDQFAEFTEIRPFTLGNQLITSSGIEATEIDILTVVLQPGDIEHNIKNLVYLNTDLLYFGVTGREMSCDPENLLVDVDTGGWGGGYVPDAYVCDQRPTQIDFKNLYTKKL